MPGGGWTRGGDIGIQRMSIVGRGLYLRKLRMGGRTRLLGLTGELLPNDAIGMGVGRGCFGSGSVCGCHLAHFAPRGASNVQLCYT